MHGLGHFSLQTAFVQFFEERDSNFLLALSVVHSDFHLDHAAEAVVIQPRVSAALVFVRDGSVDLLRDLQLFASIQRQTFNAQFLHRRGHRFLMQLACFFLRVLQCLFCILDGLVCVDHCTGELHHLIQGYCHACLTPF
ncbi:MAG TPA: hypothetical protein VIY48_13310 [Candidatus Paceibacterota bacterium]